MRYFIVLLLIFSGIFAKAQVTEYHPSIGWGYVKSQSLTMVDGMWYNTEFAAEKGFDYIFILNHLMDSAMASIQVFNLEDEYVKAKNTDTSMKVIDLPFDVKESGVYRVFFGVNDQKGSVNKHDVQFMLVRRKKV
ncbi:MAG: hypothetical protein ACKVQB_05705 [Bacteroidia bacterium]